MPDLHLRVYIDKSELVHTNGQIEIFLEGSTSVEAKQRYRKIEMALSAGYLEQQIALCKNEEGSTLGFHVLNEQSLIALDRLVDAITSDVGRALIALTIMQLCVKAIEPTQSIRLHKGGGKRGDFSWKEGISMRSLDKRFITPTLRKHDLVLLNADGFMMTRSLAENYPYSAVYKAQTRGARNEWLQTVEGIEANVISPEPALRYLLSQLLNRAEEFKYIANETLVSLERFIENSKLETIVGVIVAHINQSDYAARLMEIAMHSLMQALSELGALEDYELVPLSQMRSANKKHGNIADIELIRNEQIVEAWDAKYGKTYLRDELEELNDKLFNHPEIAVAGFVSSDEPARIAELAPRIAQIEEIHGIKLRLSSLSNWIQEQLQRVQSEGLATSDETAKKWLRAYGESLAQRKREIAPIDEPCHKWIESLKTLVET